MKTKLNGGGRGIKPPGELNPIIHSRFVEWWIRNERGQTPDDIGRGFSAWLLGIIVIAAVVGLCMTFGGCDPIGRGSPFDEHLYSTSKPASRPEAESRQ